MNIFLVPALSLVKSDGYRVLAPGEEIAAEEAVEVLRKRSYRVMPPDAVIGSAEAAQVLMERGYSVFPPMSVPAAGTAWKPTTANYTRKPRTSLQALELLERVREIVQVTATHVTYCIRDSLPLMGKTIKLGSWHGWLRRVRAKQIL